MKLRSLRVPLSSLGALLALITVAGAGQIDWGSTRFAENRTSTEAPMDGSFVFEVGVFEAGFVPTAANVDQWVSRWTMAQQAGYAEEGDFFTGSYVVESNAMPFAEGAQGYIWGFNTRAPGQMAEWILLTAGSWNWPEAGGVMQPVNWTTGSASTVVLGAMNDPGGSFHMKTAQVGTTGLLVTRAAWIAEHFPGATPNAAFWAADADGDGMSNGLEYTLGMQDRPRMEFVQVGGSKYAVLAVFRNGFTEASYEVQVSSDMTEWLSGGAHLEVLEDAEDLLLVRSLRPVEDDFNFMRLRVVVPE